MPRTREIPSSTFPRSTARAALREATAPAHARVDRLFGTADLGSHAGYAAFLTAQACAQLPAEAALDAAGAARIVPDWPQRRRAALLRADLAALAASVPDTEPADLGLDGAPAILGAIYVLEGSRLGGTLLRRQVAAGLPTAFLGASDPAGWRRLLQLLEEGLHSTAERTAAIAAAEQVFALFERGARRLHGA